MQDRSAHSEYVEQRHGGFYVVGTRVSLDSIAHEQEVHANIREGEAEIERSVPPLSASRPELYARLERARHEMASQDLAKH
ncbi:MAG: hypothetical protein ABUS49_07020 [Acidobacteriota bacterium]